MEEGGGDAGGGEGWRGVWKGCRGVKGGKGWKMIYARLKHH